VSDRLGKQIAVEREMLGQLLDDHEPLLVKCRTAEPDRIEISALAAMLHAFYSGIENIFKRVAIETDDGFAQGAGWHKRLLESMTSAATRRGPVLSKELAEDLRAYLDFRHVFRQAYTFQLRWARMAPLVFDCRLVFDRLESELDLFVDRDRRAP